MGVEKEKLFQEFKEMNPVSGQYSTTRYKLPARIREADRIAMRKRLGINGKKGDRMALLGSIRLEIDRMRLTGLYDALTLGAMQAHLDAIAVIVVDRRVKLTPEKGAEIERWLRRGFKPPRIARYTGLGQTAVRKYLVTNGWCIDGMFVRKRINAEVVNERGILDPATRSYESPEKAFLMAELKMELDLIGR